LETAEPKLLSGMARRQEDRPRHRAGSAVGDIDGIEKAAGTGYAGATVTGRRAPPKFNDLSGATRSQPGGAHTALATTDGTVLAPPSTSQTAYQQEAAELIATAVLNQADGESG